MCSKEKRRGPKKYGDKGKMALLKIKQKKNVKKLYQFKFYLQMRVPILVSHLMLQHQKYRSMFCIIVDGKEASKDILTKIDPKDIHDINVLKNEEAINKTYGDKAKNGVVLITTKNQCGCESRH